MEAIPLASGPGLPTLPQAPRERRRAIAGGYARPGPARRAAPSRRPHRELDEPEARARRPRRSSRSPSSPRRERSRRVRGGPPRRRAAAPATAQPARTARARPAAPGLRFGEELADRRELDEDERPRASVAAAPPRGARPPGTPEPRARPRRRGRRSRRFEVDDEDIEEGLHELHGEEFDFGFEDERRRRTRTTRNEYARGGLPSVRPHDQPSATHVASPVVDAGDKRDADSARPRRGRPRRHRRTGPRTRARRVLVPPAGVLAARPRARADMVATGARRRSRPTTATLLAEAPARPSRQLKTASASGRRPVGNRRRQGRTTMTQAPGQQYAFRRR